MERREQNEYRPYELAEFLDRIKRIREQLKPIVLNARSRRENAIEATKIIEPFLEELLADKDRFSHVFQTARGSIYFQLKTGQALRFKRPGIGMFGVDAKALELPAEERWETASVAGIVEMAVFMNSENVQKLLANTTFNGEDPTVYEITTPALGMHPVELNPIGTAKNSYHISGNQLSFTGKIAPSSLHAGNEISAIFK
jgi:hypothetical protein